MSSTYTSLLKTALPLTNYAVLMSSIQHAIIQAVEHKESFINGWGHDNLRGHRVAVAVGTAVQEACEQSLLPLTCSISKNKAGNYLIPKFVSDSGLAFYVCQVHSPVALPSHQPFRQAAFSKNGELFGPNEFPVLTSALITHSYSIKYVNKQPEVVVSVAIGVPDKEWKTWIERISVREELANMASAAYAAEEQVPNYKLTFRDKKGQSPLHQKAKEVSA